MIPRRHTSKRAGATLICVLVCVSVSTAILSSMVCNTLRAKRQERLQRQMVQTEFLLDAAISRASQRLARDSGYTGEVWQPTAALPDFEDVQVDINISQASEESDSKLVKLVVRLAKGAVHPIATQRSHSFEFTSPTSNQE
ncbi:MAG: hypothetical protein ACO1RT_15190 [Planctomycetaceae bacterium]